jgi:hypothetical protein
MKLKRRRSETLSDIQRELQAVLDSIKENDIHDASQEWGKLWDHCIRSQGDYFEYVKPALLFFFFALVRELSDTPCITSANTNPLHVTIPQFTIPKCTYNLK